MLSIMIIIAMLVIITMSSFIKNYVELTPKMIYKLQLLLP